MEESVENLESFVSAGRGELGPRRAMVLVNEIIMLLPKLRVRSAPVLGLPVRA
jgi:hypothetical protein